MLETTIDRSEFGLNVNALLPNVRFVIANDVKLSIELQLVQR